MTIKLYPFQEDDVNKLKLQPHVLNANDMGCGKTYEAIALDLERRIEGHGKTLVISPKSNVGSPWHSHYEELTDLKVVSLDPKQRENSWKNFVNSDADVLCLHWDILRMMPQLQTINWLHVIADECHRGQNRKAQTTKALKKIKAQYRTAMSGTPITNQADKLWSILNWLYPKEFSSYWKFYGRYCDVEIMPQGFHKIKGPKNEAELLARIDKFYVRHLKKDRCCEHHPNGVLPDLPDKYYSKIEVELTGKQATAYKQMKKESIAWIGQNESTPLVAPVVVAQLTRLQQFAVSYAEVNENDGSVTLAEPSSKLDALMELIDSTDKQIVVFSQFAQAIALLNNRLAANGISYSCIMGSVSATNRQKAVEDFQAGRSRIFTGTIAAGGVGLTLTAADTIVFIDRTWSPALNIQAEDRIHRIGQKNAVHVIDIMAKGTVDLGRAQKVDLKLSWIKKLLGDTK